MCPPPPRGGAKASGECCKVYAELPRTIPVTLSCSLGNRKRKVWLLEAQSVHIFKVSTENYIEHGMQLLLLKTIWTLLRDVRGDITQRDSTDICMAFQCEARKSVLNYFHLEREKNYKNLHYFKIKDSKLCVLVSQTTSYMNLFSPLCSKLKSKWLWKKCLCQLV